MVFSTQGTAGKLFPFGGGAHICPGRVFAKQEILAAVSTVLLGFEMEFVGWAGGKGEGMRKEGLLDEEDVKNGFPGHKRGHVGLGIMAMEWDARMRVRRRRRRGDDSGLEF